jgi:glycosyltransferase involved in cell wall biosynthesis
MNLPLISGKDFIVFGLQPWDFELGGNCRNIALELARHNRVLYVNRPIERSSLYKFRKDPKIQNRLRSLRQGRGVLEKHMENLWVFNPRVILESINWLPPGTIYNYISRINAKRLGLQIQWAANELKFNKDILFIDNDFLKGFYLNEYVQAGTFVFYIRDFLLSQPYFKKHGKKMEPALMTKADIVVANSHYLANYGKKYNQNSYDIGQGCELDAYLEDKHSEPEDLKKIPRPVIGYTGALLNTRLDIGLLEKIARQKTEWSIVLIGPEDEAFLRSGLHSMKNVFFTGPKPAQALPAYVHHFDVCINPQLRNQMTEGNYPRKIDEYLAAGKPVVATETEAMQLFREYCILAQDADGYVQGIDQILNRQDNRPDALQKRAFAMSHTWEASVMGLYQAIHNFNSKRKPE